MKDRTTHDSLTGNDGVLIHCEQSAAALVEMFVWWEVPISMRVEWRCASMTSGEQCVMIVKALLMHAAV